MDHPAVRNLSMDVRDRDGEIVFLKKVREGPSSNSYGIHVARLAGLPAETLAYAEKMLADLDAGMTIAAVAPPVTAMPPSPQRELFSPRDLVIQEILGLEPDRLTPLDALTAIARWKKELGGNGHA
jgi:DNA mismatch repair protein MutS